MTNEKNERAVLVERNGRIVRILLNRPRVRNALSFAVYRELEATFHRVAEMDDVRAVIVTGAPADRPAFAAGADISEFRQFRTEQDVRDYQALNYRVVHALEDLPAPTIAAIAGPCVGGGAILAAACDIRVASTSATFGIPVARTLGNCLSMDDFRRLVALLGMARTKELVMSARLIGAAEMREWGLVSHVADGEDALRSHAADLADRIAANAPLTMAETKRSLKRVRDHTPDSDDDTSMLRCFTSDDFRAGVEAFLTKQPYEWTGR